MSVPVFASKPACTMAEFAFDVPAHTSSSASSTRKRPSRRLSSRAMEHPLTPAPITSASYIVVPSIGPSVSQ